MMAEKGLKFDDTLVCKKCSFLEEGAKKGEVTAIRFPVAVWKMWETATRVHPSLEIMGLAHVDTEGVVTELVIPKQEIESGSCTLLKQEGDWELCIHSHHSMGAKFSTMDDDTVLPNYRFSVVTNHSGGMEAVEKVDLPCGGIGFKTIKVLLDSMVDGVDVQAIVNQQCETPAQRAKAKGPTTTVYPAHTSMVVHHVSCRCAKCEDEWKERVNNHPRNQAVATVTPQQAAVNAVNGKEVVPFGKATTKKTTMGIPGGGRGARRRRREAALANTMRTPRTIACANRECTRIIFTATDSYGTNEEGDPLCERCWDIMYDEEVARVRGNGA